MTRFGEIAPLWHNFKNLGQNFECEFCIWQKCILLWQKCYVIGQIFIAVNGQIFCNKIGIKDRNFAQEQKDKKQKMYSVFTLERGSIYWRVFQHWNCFLICFASPSLSLSLSKHSQYNEYISANFLVKIRYFIEIVFTQWLPKINTTNFS